MGLCYNITMESRGRFWNVMGSGFFLLISLVAIIALAVAFIKDYRRKVELDAEIKNWQEKIVTLEKKKLELNNLINYYTSDEFMERELRLRLGLKKTGEQVVVLPQANNASIPVWENSSVKSNWQKWWYYFFKE